MRKPGAAPIAGTENVLQLNLSAEPQEEVAGVLRSLEGRIG